MARFKLLLLLLITSFTVFSQENNTIKSGEKLTYSASYTMSGLLTRIAQITMETSTVKTSKSTLLHLKCSAATYSKWDSFFKIRDLYESFVNPANLKPYLHKRSVNEGGYIKNVKYVFKHKSGRVTSTVTKKNSYKKESEFTLSAGTYDVVTTLYQMRTMDIHKAPIGAVQQMNVLFDNKKRTFSLSYLGKETISVNGLGSTTCYKISVSSNEALLKGSAGNTIWLTADARKIPVLIKFNIPVGSGNLSLVSAEGIGSK